jgi:hypothetical protein
MLIGAAGVATIVSQGLSPTATSRREQEVHVALAEIGPQDLKRVTWRGESVVVLGGDEPRAFRSPYDPDLRVHLMPDRSWYQLRTLCASIVLVDDVLSCAGRAEYGDLLHCHEPNVTTTFAWRRSDGASLASYVPNLESPPYVVAEGTLILGRTAPD